MSSLTKDKAQEWKHCPWPEIPNLKDCPCCYLGAVTCVCPLWSNYKMRLGFDLGTVHRAVWELAAQEVSYQNNSFLIWIIWTIVLVLNDPNKSIEYFVLYISYWVRLFFFSFDLFLFCSVLFLLRHWITPIPSEVCWSFTNRFSKSSFVSMNEIEARYGNAEFACKQHKTEVLISLGYWTRNP